MDYEYRHTSYNNLIPEAISSIASFALHVQKSTVLNRHLTLSKNKQKLFWDWLAGSNLEEMHSYKNCLIGTTEWSASAAQQEDHFTRPSNPIQLNYIRSKSVSIRTADPQLERLVCSVNEPAMSQELLSKAGLIKGQFQTDSQSCSWANTWRL